MTTDKKIARRKLSLLELAQDLGNVSKACKVMGYSRQQFYEIRRNFQTFGSDGLLDRMAGAKSPHPNRVSPELEEAVLAYSLEFPTRGSVRMSHDLRLQGLTVGQSAIRGVWSRHGLLTKHERLMRLERAQQEKSFELNPEQVKLLERFSPEFRERHIEAPYTGALVAVDTFMVGAMKGVGRIYMQTVIDCHSRFAFGRLYTSKMPVTAVHILNTDVLPHFEAHDAKVETILSDNGREFCGRPDQHPYELFLQLEGIEHRTTKVRRPQSNGIAERMHRTLLDEHFRIEGRKTWYESVEQMQGDLDRYLQEYNHKRPHQGRNMNGRVPYEVFLEGVLTSVKEEEVDPTEAA